MKRLKIIIFISSLIPIEFIGLFTDYQTGLLIGYIPFVIVATLISYFIFQFGFKGNISIVIARIVGVFFSWICVHLFMDIYHSSDYFMPFTTDSFSIILGVIHILVIIFIYLVMYSFSYRNK